MTHKVAGMLVFAVLVASISNAAQAQDRPQTRERQFERLDTNGDLKISKQEWAARGLEDSQFARLNRDSDDFIDLGTEIPSRGQGGEQAGPEAQ